MTPEIAIAIAIVKSQLPVLEWQQIDPASQKKMRELAKTIIAGLEAAGFTIKGKQ